MTDLCHDFCMHPCRLMMVYMLVCLRSHEQIGESQEVGAIAIVLLPGSFVFGCRSEHCTPTGSSQAVKSGAIDACVLRGVCLCVLRGCERPLRVARGSRSRLARKCTPKRTVNICHVWCEFTLRGCPHAVPAFSQHPLRMLKHLH